MVGECLLRWAVARSYSNAVLAAQTPNVEVDATKLGHEMDFSEEGMIVAIYMRNRVQ